MSENLEERARIGQQLAELRNKRGLSTRKLADLCGVDFSNISKIERGRYNVSVEVLAKICKPLNARLTIVPLDDRLPDFQE